MAPNRSSFGNLNGSSLQDEDRKENKEECNNQDPVQDQPSQSINPQKQSKRGPYKKDPTKLIGKRAFLAKIDSQYKWILYDSNVDKLFCKLCISASEKLHNLWGDPSKGFPHFLLKKLKDMKNQLPINDLKI